MMTQDQIRQELRDRYSWSDEAIDIGIRGRFCCEYCGRDLLASVDDYDSWQRDHVIPVSKNGEDEMDNLAVSCKTCNFIKRDWLPSAELIVGKTRDQLVALARNHIQAIRTTKQLTLAETRQLACDLLD